MNNLNNHFHISHIMDCALLSIDVYREKSEARNNLLADWECIREYEPEKKPYPRILGNFENVNDSFQDGTEIISPSKIFDDYSSSEDIKEMIEQEKRSPQNFFARLYGNIHTQETIIAYRGTSLARRGDIGACLDIGELQWDAYDTAALDFYNTTPDFIAGLGKKSNPASYSTLPTLTGHSLGGYLAQAVADGERNNHVIAIVFDAPGTGGLYNPNTGYRITGHNSNILNIVVNTEAVHHFGGYQTGTVHTLVSHDNCAMQLARQENPTANWGAPTSMNMEYTSNYSYVTCALFVEHSIDTLYSLLKEQSDINL